MKKNGYNGRNDGQIGINIEEKEGRKDKMSASEERLRSALHEVAKLINTEHLLSQLYSRYGVAFDIADPFVLGIIMTALRFEVEEGRRAAKRELALVEVREMAKQLSLL